MNGSGYSQKQQCAFDVSARELCRYFLGQKSLREDQAEYATAIRVEDELFASDFMLVPNNAPTALYSLSISSMYLFRKNGWGSTGEYESLASLGTVGRIDFEQARQGESTAILYIDKRPSTWAASDDQDEMLYGIGVSILSRFWKDRVESWTDRKPTVLQGQAEGAMLGSSSPTDATKVKTRRGGARQYGMRRGTEDKINRVGSDRNKTLRERGKVPCYSISCSSFGIDTRTLRKYAPELRRRWSDKNYKWNETDLVIQTK